MSPTRRRTESALPKLSAAAAAAGVKHGVRAERAMTKIMDAAERLFALNGIEGTPLRQILIESKQGNKYAINHYFGGKDDLVVAIISRRVEAMNVHRKKLVADAKTRGDLDNGCCQANANLSLNCELVAGQGGGVFGTTFV